MPARAAQAPSVGAQTAPLTPPLAMARQDVQPGEPVRVPGLSTRPPRSLQAPELALGPRPGTEISLRTATRSLQALELAPGLRVRVQISS